MGASLCHRMAGDHTLTPQHSIITSGEVAPLATDYGGRMLYIFDLDGTLVETYGELVLPGVAARLMALAARGHSFAVATNQAGPAWRLATGEARYPDPAVLGARLARIAQKLPPLTSVPWYVATGDGRLELSAKEYHTIERAMCGASEALNLHIAADLAWRKPEPGMLRAACAHYGIPERRALFVGDSDADAGAAKNTEVRFVFADRFFGADSVVSPVLDLQGDS